MHLSLGQFVEAAFNYIGAGTHANRTACLRHIVLTVGCSSETAQHNRSTCNETATCRALKLAQRERGVVALLTPRVVGHTHFARVGCVVILHGIDIHKVALADAAYAVQKRIVFGWQRGYFVLPISVLGEVFVKRIGGEAAGKP